MVEPSEYHKAHINYLGFSSKEDLIENLYLKSISDAYGRIKKEIAIENDIRDRFVKDFYTADTLLRNFLQIKFIYVDWELWVFSEEYELGRADLCFRTTGFQFIIECKRLSHADKKYFEDGLKRFIDLKYGYGDEYAGMIGFVVNGNPKTICSKLSERAASYSIVVGSDFSLRRIDFSTPHFLTTHERIDKSLIHIYNVFLEFEKDIPFEKF
jgi:hypothetical protein